MKFKMKIEWKKHVICFKNCGCFKYTNARGIVKLFLLNNNIARIY